jgi:hypothetical protein
MKLIFAILLIIIPFLLFAQTHSLEFGGVENGLIITNGGRYADIRTTFELAGVVDHTFIMWVRNVYGYMNYSFGYYHNSSNYHQWILNDDYFYCRFRAAGDNAGWFTATAANWATSWADNEWHQLTMVMKREAARDSSGLYVDGVEATGYVTSIFTNGLSAFSEDLGDNFIGRSASWGMRDGSRVAYLGVIKDNLTAAEVLAAYNAQKDGLVSLASTLSDTIIGEWMFDINDVGNDNINIADLTSGKIIRKGDGSDVETFPFVVEDAPGGRSYPANANAVTILADEFNDFSLDPETLPGSTIAYWVFNDEFHTRYNNGKNICHSLVDDRVFTVFNGWTDTTDVQDSLKVAVAGKNPIYAVGTGKSLFFDDVGNDYIAIADADADDFVWSDLRNFTIILWHYTPAPPSASSRTVQKYTSVGAWALNHFSGWQGQPYFTAEDEQSNNYSSAVQLQGSYAGQWSTVGVTVERGAVDHADIYQNADSVTGMLHDISNLVDRIGENTANMTVGNFYMDDYIAGLLIMRNVVTDKKYWELVYKARGWESNGDIQYYRPNTLGFAQGFTQSDADSALINHVYLPPHRRLNLKFDAYYETSGSTLNVKLNGTVKSVTVTDASQSFELQWDALKVGINDTLQFYPASTSDKIVIDNLKLKGLAQRSDLSKLIGAPALKGQR